MQTEPHTNTRIHVANHLLLNSITGVVGFTRKNHKRCEIMTESVENDDDILSIGKRIGIRTLAVSTTLSLASGGLALLRRQPALRAMIVSFQNVSVLGGFFFCKFHKCSI